ncbi:MAG: hypothetical protein AAFQ42_06885 [Pseudomonadota bacterium]
MSPTRLSQSSKSIGRLVAAFLLTSGTLTLATAPVEADSRSITGKWRGNGVVNLKSGGKEQVRCSVTYGRIAGQDFSVDARCASGAGRLDQRGTLRRVQGNRYVGTLKNVQYSVTANVIVNVSGSTQSVSISSSEGTATLRLARR